MLIMLRLRYRRVLVVLVGGEILVVGRRGGVW